jgi:ferredoxin--NADP+ reductase
MADWVTGKVTKIQFWTDALFSLTVHAPVHPFTAGQFAKLGLDVDGERVQRAYSYVNAPDNPISSSIWSPSRTASSARAWRR